jgi:DNA-binding XRE family transcriptional regulator
MEEELNDLLIQAQENISDNVGKQQEQKYTQVLNDSLVELVKLKNTTDDYIMIRNTAIQRLYSECGYSAIKLGDIVGISRQMIHNIVKGNNEV